MSKKFKKVLVTGADGFIGSHLAEELTRQGYNVRAFVFYNSFNSWGWLDEAPKDLKEKLDVFAGDVRDPFAVNQAVAGCEAILHLAALVSIPFSYEAPNMYIDTNIRGTLNILEAARDHKVKKIIHTSTSEVYGTALKVPIKENHPLQAQSPYSASKIGADQIAISFYNAFDTPVAILRPFNTFGPRQSARAIIPTIVTQIARGKKKIHLGSIAPTRDFNYISDTVEGFIKALEAKNIEGETINISSNREISIGKLSETIAKLMKSEIEIVSDKKRIRPQKSEVDRLKGDNLKARKLLHWKPKYQGQKGFEAALKITIDWFLNENNLEKYKCERYNI